MEADSPKGQMNGFPGVLQLLSSSFLNGPVDCRFIRSRSAEEIWLKSASAPNSYVCDAH